MLPEVGLASGVYLAPGVTFRQEGFKYISEDGYGLNYISVPWTSVSAYLSARTSLYLSKLAPTSPTVSLPRARSDAFKAGIYKRFDMGLNASAALEFSKVYLRVGTDIGMVNALKNNIANTSYKNASFFAGVGLRF